MQFDRGYLSPYFITDAEKMICEFEDPFITQRCVHRIPTEDLSSY